jgi:hypothetical protein
MVSAAADIFASSRPRERVAALRGCDQTKQEFVLAWIALSMAGLAAAQTSLTRTSAFEYDAAGLLIREIGRAGGFLARQTIHPFRAHRSNRRLRHNVVLDRTGRRRNQLPSASRLVASRCPFPGPPGVSPFRRLVAAALRRGEQDAGATAAGISRRDISTIRWTAAGLPADIRSVISERGRPI